MSDYLAFADRLLATGAIGDPWISGQPRFREAPVLLSPGELGELYRAAEDVAKVYDEATRLVLGEPALLDDFYRLSPWQKMMWLASPAPLWHGIARADVFRTADGGLAICELNADTPTGEPEAVVLGEVAAAGDRRLTDPNAELGARFTSMLESMAQALLVRDPWHATDPEKAGPIGIIYPTEMTEDLSVIELYRSWLEARGHEVVLGSPFNVTSTGEGGLAILGTPCSVVIRHYKTDWWGERLPLLVGEPPCADAEPLRAPLSSVLDAVCRGRAVAVNPFGSVLAQNKRTMALFWERLSSFSEPAQHAIRAHLPFTARAESLPIEQLANERAYWVLKSDYGCEGDSVYVGNAMSKADWEECLARIIPERWVAQRYFATAETELGESVNYGVFVVAGRASGIYSRLEAGMTTHEARSAPTMVLG